MKLVCLERALMTEREYQQTNADRIWLPTRYARYIIWPNSVPLTEETRYQ